MHKVKIHDITIGSGGLVLIAGPCVIESEDHALFMAQNIRDIASRVGIPYIFKASFDKANRSSIDSYRGPGLIKGLKILDKIKKHTANVNNASSGTIQASAHLCGMNVIVRFYELISNVRTEIEADVSMDDSGNISWSTSNAFTGQIIIMG